MSLSNIEIVLVGPIYGGNVGSICRAMKNMGLGRLTIVAPQNPFEEDPMLYKMALTAIDIYEQRREFPTLREAVADCTAIAATTARVGLYRAHSATARSWAPEFIERASQGKVAVVFGREDHGLNNEELSLATHLVQIPSTKAYTSLNLSQAVMVCAYELYVAADRFNPTHEESPPLSLRMRERMFDLWAQTMLDTGFCKEDKLEHMLMGLRRILSRGQLTEADAKILMGLARQSQWAAKHGPTRPDPDRIQHDQDAPPSIISIDWPKLNEIKFDPENTYVVEAHTPQKEPLFASQLNRTLLQNLLFRLAATSDISLQAWHILPTGYRFVARTPKEDPASLSVMLRQLHQSAKRKLNRLEGCKGRTILTLPVDQRVRDENRWRSTMIAIHEAPQIAGLCNDAKDYPWSSAGKQEDSSQPH